MAWRTTSWGCSGQDARASGGLGPAMAAGGRGGRPPPHGLAEDGRSRSGWRLYRARGGPVGPRPGLSNSRSTIAPCCFPPPGAIGAGDLCSPLPARCPRRHPCPYRLHGRAGLSPLTCSALPPLPPLCAPSSSQWDCCQRQEGCAAHMPTLADPMLYAC